MKKENVFYLFFAILVLLKGTSVYATVYEGVCGENLTWTLNSEDSTLVISGRGDMSGVRFANQPFRDLIKYVVFPEGLTSICNNAFGETWNTCKNLQSVTLPDSVVSIGREAFLSCIGIKEVKCGKGLKSIGDSAFVYCQSLTKLELSDGLESIGNRAFLEDTALTGTIIFPEGLKSIGQEAFNTYSQNVRNLTAVWNARHCISNNDERHGSAVLHAFSNIVFGDKVEYIAKWLCSYLPIESIIIPESVDSIDANAFFFCQNLKHIQMPSRIKYLGQCAFRLCTQLGSLTIPEGISDIPYQLCWDCTSLESVSLPSQTKIILEDAFRGCTSLRNIHLPAGTQSIGGYAFEGCTGLEQIDIPESVTTIGEKAFRNCYSLTSITIPRHVTVINNFAFANCSSMKSVHMPNTIKRIETSAFQNGSLDTLLLPQELNLIGEDAFLNQRHLTGLSIPDEVRQIKNRAFKGCSSLRKVQIGKKVAMMDAESFAGDTMLTEIRIKAAYPPLVQNSTFSGVPDSTWLYVPVQSIAAYAADEVWGRFRMPKEENIHYVTVDAEETTANFTWPTDSTASSYQIDIYKDGTVFCRLTLGPKGQLLGIAFALQRNHAPMADAENTLPYTLSFMVTGLEEASRYNYVLSALDVNGKPLHVYTGDFATKGYQGELKGGGDEVLPTPPIIPSDPETASMEGIENTPLLPGEKSIKMLIDGKLLIRIGDKTYTVTGQETR